MLALALPFALALVGLQQPTPAHTLDAMSAGGGATGGVRFRWDGVTYFQAFGGAGGGRGFAVSTHDPSTPGPPPPPVVFDTWATRLTGGAHVALVNHLAAIPNGVMIAVSVGDEAGLNEFDSCALLQRPWVEQVLQTLEQLGASRLRSYCYRGSWAFLTIKGLATGEEKISASNAVMVDVGFPLRVFQDDFETTRLWSSFDESVNSCYVATGQVERVSCDIEHGQCMSVWANGGFASPLSNHVIAGKVLWPDGQYGAWSYAIDALIDGSIASEGEAGPEWSIQNTRLTSPGRTRTFTIGAQYQGNPSLPGGPGWAIWTDLNGAGGWLHVADGPMVSSDAWYRLVVEADYDAGFYRRLRIWSPSGASILNLDISALTIPGEERGWEPAFSIAAGAENRSTNCGAVPPTSYRVFYDNTRLLQIP